MLFSVLLVAALSSGPAHGLSAAHPIVVNTWPFVNATARAWQALEDGEAAVEAVVQVQRSLRAAVSLARTGCLVH